jgi:SdpC family antimicrobial peptide
MKNHLKIPVIVTMILTMLLFGIPQRTEADPPPYTGEQIFRGLIFGEAPVGGLFPEFWSSDNTLQALSTQEEIDSWNALKEAVVSKIKQQSPTYLNQFGTHIQSGDPVEVQAALVNASHRTRIAMQDLGYLDDQGNIVPGTLISGSPVFVSVALAVVAVVAAIVVVFIFDIIKNQHGPGGEGDTQYYRDWAIGLITSRLANPQ